MKTVQVLRVNDLKGGDVYRYPGHNVEYALVRCLDTNKLMVVRLFDYCVRELSAYEYTQEVIRLGRLTYPKVD